MSWPWSELGLEGPCDSGEVKRAYAQRVKTVHPEEDPEGFQQLYAAYQTARRIARAAEQDARLLMEMEDAAPPRRDSNALLGEDPVQLPPEPGESERFDYDALFAEEDLEIPPPQPPPDRPPPKAEDFDYEELLAGGGEEPPPPARSTGPEAWDYEKLFAEGDEERRQARRRKAEERLREARERRKAQTEETRARRKAQEQAQRDRALESEEAWSAAYTALHALEVLWSASVPVDEWVVFLHSSAFLNAQHNMDFIFGLEDFLTEHPYLPAEIKRHIYLAYHFYNGKPETMYLGLYRLLKESGERAENGRQKMTSWRKRVFRRERAPLFLLWILLSVIFIDYFFLSGRAVKKEGPEPGSISMERQEDPDSRVPPASDSPLAAQEDPPDQERQGIEAVRDLAVALAGQDYPSLYAITNTGIAENAGESYYWAQCTGRTESGETLVMNYFLSLDGTQVCCVSDEENTGVLQLELAGTTAAGGKTVSIYRCPK